MFVSFVWKLYLCCQSEIADCWGQSFAANMPMWAEKTVSLPFQAKERLRKKFDIPFFFAERD
jgi:hypothetical protein